MYIEKRYQMLIPMSHRTIGIATQFSKNIGTYDRLAARVSYNLPRSVPLFQHMDVIMFSFAINA